jgi:Ni/Co efflux regulator RcnB
MIRLVLLVLAALTLTTPVNRDATADSDRDLHRANKNTHADIDTDQHANSCGMLICSFSIRHRIN